MARETPQGRAKSVLAAINRALGRLFLILLPPIVVMHQQSQNLVWQRCGTISSLLHAGLELLQGALSNESNS